MPVLALGVVAVIIIGVRLTGNYATHHAPTVPASFAGLWSGTVSQPRPARSFTVSIILTTHSSTGGISYGDDLCSGRLREMTTVSSTGVSFGQSLTYVPDTTCPVHGGTVTLSRPTGSTIDLRISGPAVAVGTLQRQ